MGRRRARLLLTHNAEDVPEGGAAVYRSLTSLTSSFAKEPAGHIYHLVALKQAGLYEYPEEEDENDTGDESSNPSRQNSTSDFASLEEEAAAGTKWGGKGKKRSKKKKNDLYALLGLQHERWCATPEQIKAAYRAAALKHHPDKLNAAAGESEKAKVAIEERFKAIQEAYETLSDLGRRREYDSTDHCDDSVPSAETDPADFYKVFGAAFRRNARWSLNTPVPELGDDDAPLSAVDAFYAFWFAFRSWREFPHPDEEDVECAESREHRRWIERYNSKLRERARKDEVRRIRGLVEAAERCDPRLQRRKDAERAEREAKVAEREAARVAAEEAERRRLVEEEERRVADEAAAVEARKARQIEKKALQKERGRLRRLAGTAADGAPPEAPGIASALDEDEVELLCASLSLTHMSELCAALAAADLGADVKAAAVQARVDEVRGCQGQEAAAKEAALRAIAAAAAEEKAREERERMAKLSDWDEEEVRLLKKAVEKFPPGTAKRWEVVQAYVRTRTLEECVEMVKHGLKAGRFGSAPSSADSFSIARKRQGNTVIKAEADTRAAAFSDVAVNLKGDAAVLLAGAAGAAEAEAPAAGGGEGDAAAADVWSEAQEVDLVKALKRVGKEVPDRWGRVAELVPGKTKAQCHRRFKEMKEAHKSKKTGNGAKK